MSQNKSKIASLHCSRVNEEVNKTSCYVTLRGTLFTCTNCWVAALASHWVWFACFEVKGNYYGKMATNETEETGTSYVQFLSWHFEPRFLRRRVLECHLRNVLKKARKEFVDIPINTELLLLYLVFKTFYYFGTPPIMVFFNHYASF